MQRILIYIILIIILEIINILPALAQVIQIATLTQALDQAIKNNPQLSATRARLGVSEAQIMTANAWLNPAIVTDNGIAEKTYRVGIQEIFELGGKRDKRRALAQAQRDVVASEIDTAILDLKKMLGVHIYSYIMRNNGCKPIMKYLRLLKSCKK